MWVAERGQSVWAIIESMNGKLLALCARDWAIECVCLRAHKCWSEQIWTRVYSKYAVRRACCSTRMRSDTLQTSNQWICGTIHCLPCAVLLSALTVNDAPSIRQTLHFIVDASLSTRLAWDLHFSRHVHVRAPSMIWMDNHLSGPLNDNPHCARAYDINLRSL